MSIHIRSILFSKKALVVGIVFLLMTTAGYLNYQSRTVQKHQENQVTPFEQAKYLMIAIMQQAQEATVSAQSNTSPPRIYTYWKATVAYLPLADVFIGGVDTAESIREYRLAKRLIVEHLTEKGVDVCDLNIFWFRPEAVEKEELTPQDVKTDGCK